MITYTLPIRIRLTLKMLVSLIHLIDISTWHLCKVLVLKVGLQLVQLDGPSTAADI